MTTRPVMNAFREQRTTTRFWIGWGVALFISGILVFLASLPPFLDVGPRTLLHHGFAWACHQIPERSFHFDGIQLAVCHRCYGIYWGLPLAVIGFLGASRWDHYINPYAKYVLIGAVLPPGIDWLGGVLGLWVSSAGTQVVTGALFGLAVGYFLARSFVTALADRPCNTRDTLT